MNRIKDAIARKEKEIAERIANGITTAERVAESHAKLDMEVDEFCQFQELKSLAQVHGIITEDEAMTIYSLLGEIPSVFNARPIATKAVLTGFLGELLRLRVAGRL